MTNVLVTGANGFIGKNLIDRLKRLDVTVNVFDSKDDLQTLEHGLMQADLVYHLAGVNRPEREQLFMDVNAGLTEQIVTLLARYGHRTPVVLASSSQAVLDNPYGKSKKSAEQSVLLYGEKTGAKCYIYRLPNVFGKWCRPNYNSVVATFCHNIARDLDITISDPERKLSLVYIDDVVDSLASLIAEIGREGSVEYRSIDRLFEVTLGELVDKLRLIKDIRISHVLPDLSDPFMKCLHATYLSYLPKQQFAYPLEMKIDNRGSLAEIVKSKQFGQIFVSKSYKGIVRGNHYHHTKVEKFCVINGRAVIKFRNVFEEDVLSYEVSGDDIQVVDIPPGYTHSIENMSDGELIVLFWANEIFDPQSPDTYLLEV
ncbi:polysaccharide biosynthesis C-terminal domain-containing protein [Paenibacillus sp. GYB003]|uniref:polysaccharide biosynthesis C-terminal domain-containing protein n=1 Tax=Paenibacillus sp. GYB003 TaxID=2994392 RepID=UPI002F967BAF